MNRRRRRPAKEREPHARGAVAVEFALIVSLVLALGLGAFEFGSLWRSSSATTGATRDGARTLSALGSDRVADYEALQATRTALASAGLLSSVQRVVIFKSTTSDGQPPAGCATGTPSNESCHVITGAQLRALTAADLDAKGCLTAALAKNYCPTDRTTTKAGADYVGIWIGVDHRFVTTYFGAGRTLKAHTVMRLEPR